MDCGGLEQELRDNGVDIIRYVDISDLPESSSKGFAKAILIGITLSKEYLNNLRNSDRVVSKEFSEKELQVDGLAEWTANYLKNLGYNAFAQSEKNLLEFGLFNAETKTSVLPAKTIATLSGLGWIGKNNLLITHEYGCAICMCSILTDAPLETDSCSVTIPECGECDICKQICPADAIEGSDWAKGCERSSLVDVFRCVCCLKCLSHCRWTVDYAR